MNRIYFIFGLLLSVTSMLSRSISIKGADYVLYFMFLALFVIWSIDKGIKCPLRYVILLSIFVALLILNYVFKPFPTRLVHFVLGSVFTCLPFIHFIVSRNIMFTDNEIQQYARIFMIIVMVLGLIPLTESLILRNVELDEGLINSNIIGVGFYCSMCNIALILGLMLYYLSGNRNYLFYCAFFLLMPVLIVQTKAIIGSILVILGYFYIRSRRKARMMLGSVVFLLMCIPIVISVPAVRNKVFRQVDIYFGDEALESTARTLLYVTSVSIANDYFPLGSGQGTYGSIPVNMYESPVYAQYGIDEVWGISYTDDANFRLDTHWSYILGECGYLGTLLYLMLFLFPLSCLRVNNKNSRKVVIYKFAVVMTLMIVCIESFALPLPNRFGFIFIYAGIIPIMERSLTEENVVDEV